MLVSSLPSSPDTIDAAWLTDALGASQPGTLVAALQQTKTIHGAGTKLRIQLDFAHNPHDLPQTMWIKAGWEPHSTVMEESGNYAREAIFFDHLQVPGVRAPRCFHAAWTPQGCGLIIMEDLHERGAELWDCTVARAPSDVAAVLDTLARLHARWWDSNALLAMGDIDISMRSEGPLSVWPRANGAARLREVLSGPRGEGLPEYVKAPDRIERAFWRMVNSLEVMERGCLVHGDPHPGNCFSDSDGGAGLYDWQTIARGPWAFDVAYNIVTSLAPEDRRDVERDLLAHYCASLASHGVANPPNEEEAWNQYRRHIAYPLLIWPTNHVSHQAEENIRAMTYRTGIAAADFGFFELWDV